MLFDSCARNGGLRALLRGPTVKSPCWDVNWQPPERSDGVLCSWTTHHPPRHVHFQTGIKIAAWGSPFSCVYGPPHYRLSYRRGTISEGKCFMVPVTLKMANRLNAQTLNIFSVGSALENKKKKMALSLRSPGRWWSASVHVIAAFNHTGQWRAYCCGSFIMLIYFHFSAQWSIGLTQQHSDFEYGRGAFLKGMSGAFWENIETLCFKQRMGHILLIWRIGIEHLVWPFF